MSSRHLIGRASAPPPPRRGETPSPPLRSSSPPPAPSPAGAGPRRRLRAAILASGLGLSCLAGGAILTTAMGGSAITDQVNARTASAGRQAAGYLEQSISSSVSGLDGVANQLPILAVVEGGPAADTAAATADLVALAKSEPDAQGIALADASGSPVLRTGPQDPLIGLPAGWAGEATHTGFLAAAAPGSLADPAVVVAVPVLEGGGGVGGFLVERYRLAGAVTSLQALAAAQGMSLLVVDSSGGLVVGVQPAGSSGGPDLVTAWAPEPSYTSGATRAIGSRTVQMVDSSAAGAAAYAPVTEAPWAVRAALPGSALAAVANLQILVAGIGGALALLFVAAVVMVSRAMGRRERTEAALIAQAAAMEHAAMHDPLTGLPNRLLFNDRLQHGISNARRSGRPLSLFILDIDGFKALNDALGHTAGDLVLRETAARLQASVRVSDTVARLGGDEFVIVAVDADPADAELIGTKVRQRMEEAVTVEDRPVPVGLSMGLAVFPGDGADPAQLLRRADSNMYRDKRARKAAPS